MHVINFLSKEKSDLGNILFEGFPRFISQYEALSNFLKNKGDDIDAVISLEVSEEEAIKRISSRRVCEKCGENFNLITKSPVKEGICDKCGGNLILRADDSPESVKVRFVYYRENTKELIDYVEKIGKLTRVDGARPIDEIQKDLVEIVNKLQK
jgi:adenylate kinase